LKGALEHKDSLGTGSVIRREDVQRMSAGSGVQHSEFNHSQTELVHFLQIWITPEQRGLRPDYAEARFTDTEKRGQLRLIVSGNGRDGSVPIRQDIDLYAALLMDGETVAHQFAPNRNGWIQVACGAIILNGATLSDGDGAAILNEDSISIRSTAEAEVLLFAMA
jgi:redox-sensitive bicupin YhaK (pirin superfamily)